MAIVARGDFQRRMARRKWLGWAFHALCLLAIALALAMLAALLVYVASKGWSRVDWAFLTSFPSRNPELAGIKPALLGSIYAVAIAGLVAFALGLSAAIYLEEYAARSWFARLVQINIANLAGVPSIVYGILGLEIFVRSLGLGKKRVGRGIDLGPTGVTHCHHRR